MGRLELTTRIQAPPERCFDLSRSVDLHVASTAKSGERAVGGVTSGMLGPGDEVTWRARHLGVWQNLSTRITRFDRPGYFRDSMVAGAFTRFDHDHYFDADPADASACIMRDVFDFTSPLGPLGRVVDRVFLDRYMRAFLVERNEVIRAAAESDDWQQQDGHAVVGTHERDEAERLARLATEQARAAGFPLHVSVADAGTTRASLLRRWLRRR